MNRTFSLVWSSRQHALVVASEFACGRRKIGSGQAVGRPRLSSVLAVGTVSLVGAIATLPAHAYSVGGAFQGCTDQGDTHIAIGEDATACDTGTVALGFGAVAELGTTDTIALGRDALANEDGAVALGAGAAASIENSVALGAGATTDTVEGTANTTFNGRLSSEFTGGSDFAGATPLGTVSVGSGGAERTMTHVAAGRVEADSTDAVNGSQLFATNQAVGEALRLAAAPDSEYFSVDDSGDAAATGGATGPDSVAAGVGATADAERSAAFGTGAAAGGIGSIALGNDASADEERSIALGNAAIAGDPDSIGIGTGAFANAPSSISVGTDSRSAGIDGVAIGRNAVADGASSVAIGGGDLESDGVEGTNAVASGERAVALGTGTLAAGVDSIAVGQGANVLGGDGVAFGRDAAVTGEASMALGAGASAAIDNSVALGAASTTQAVVATDSATIAGTTYAFAGSAPEGTISIGGVGAERTLTNVAAGRIAGDSTDAVNGSQLFATNQAVESIDDRVTDVEGDVTDLGDEIDRLDDSAVQYDVNDDGSIDQSQVTFDGDDGTTLTNVAAGDVEQGSTDAVNGGQLWRVQNQIENVANGGTDYFTANSDGPVAEADGAESTAMGPRSVASGDNSVAAGNGATATSDGGVALGSGSEATREGMDGAEERFSGESVASTRGAVAVGSAGGERQITNVAGGTESTDAVNVRQLEAVQAGSLSYDRNDDGSVDYSSVTLGNGDGPTQVRNVAAGTSTTDAVNVGQLRALGDSVDSRFDRVDRRIDDVEDEANAGSASAIAVASVPQAYLPGKSMISGGVGNYNGESAIALGVSRLTDNGRWAVKLNGTANTQDSFGFGGGVGFHW